MEIVPNPRSTLHALAPMGFGTPEVESLTSYFCRLAHSHGMTARHLAAWILEHYAQFVPDDFKWFRRSFSGLSTETEQWAAWLAELTGVANLDQLTLGPWRHLIANPSLAPVSDRWCPCCLAEDRARGRTPYLRLNWDVASVTACPHHEVNLVSTCPHCCKSNVRNRAATVVVGYCTSCCGFLGEAKARPATPPALWAARQVDKFLATPPGVAADGLVSLLEALIERMAGGSVTTFARRLDLSKSGVWHWVRKGGSPSLPAWLAIARHSGLPLHRLFAGDLSDWTPFVESVQFTLPLLTSPRKGIRSRELDWDAIREQLRTLLAEETPITLVEACRRTGVEHKLLYLRANAETRALVDRSRRYQEALRQGKVGRLQEQVGQLVQERLEAGYEGVSARDVWARLDDELKSVRHTYRHVAKAVVANDA